MTLVDQLIACGAVASRTWPWRKLFYALKDRILKIYGSFDGYDLQIFVKPGFYDFDPNCDGTEHCHILARYELNGHIFHIPTDEFSYFNFDTQSHRQSNNYAALKPYCQNIIEGRKTYLASRQDTTVAWIALKALVREHGRLLRKPSPQLTLFPETTS